MLRYLHALAAFFFYVLGATFFYAYVLVRNGVGDTWPAWWLQVADLPLLFSAVVYAGLSFYLSVASPQEKALRYVIAVPLGFFFLWMMLWNFSNLWWR